MNFVIPSFALAGRGKILGQHCPPQSMAAITQSFWLASQSAKVMDLSCQKS
jgi:hypothetical protein